MVNEVERNREFVEAINTDKKNYLSYFVIDFEEELDDIERTLDTESSKILLNWVRDKLHRLQGEFDAEV